MEVKLLLPFSQCVSHLDIASGRCANCVWGARRELPDCEFVGATKALKEGRHHQLAHWLQNAPASVKFTSAVMPSVKVVKGPALRHDLMPDEAWDEMAKAQRDRYLLLAPMGAAMLPVDIGMMDIDG